MGELDLSISCGNDFTNQPQIKAEYIEIGDFEKCRHVIWKSLLLRLYSSYATTFIF